MIIIGGGPAGMSAAVWCTDLGLKAVLFERSSTLGGQLLWTHGPITNYLGAEVGSGAELASKFAEQVGRSRIEVIAGRGLATVDLNSKSIVVDDTTWTADAIVVATGVRRRKLSIPGEAEFEGRGILGSGARDRDLVVRKTVVIVGGGDAALENALILGEVARKVSVVHRRGEFSARREFVEKARARPNVDFVLDAQITEIQGSGSVESVTVARASGDRSMIACDALLIRVGVEPNTDLFAEQIGLDERGYFVVDGEFRTTAGGVWAIGDVAAPSSMTIANAVGAGSAAAKSIANRR